MIYQKILTRGDSYALRLGQALDFPSHAHCDIEVVFCLEGRLSFNINKDAHFIEAGEILVVGSMTDHSYFNEPNSSKNLLIMLGPVFLREKFSCLSKLNSSFKVYKKDENKKLSDCLRELLAEQGNSDELSRFLIKSTLRRFFVYLVRDIADESKDSHDFASVGSISKVQQAVELVHQSYASDLTVEEVARRCCYGTSNFCKIFKSAMGISFHKYLNKVRIENAKYLLTETDISVEGISESVGFRDAKVFSRAFKEQEDMTPSEYRRKSGVTT